MDKNKTKIRENDWLKSLCEIPCQGSLLNSPTIHKPGGGWTWNIWSRPQFVYNSHHWKNLVDRTNICFVLALKKECWDFAVHVHLYWSFTILGLFLNACLIKGDVWIMTGVILGVTRRERVMHFGSPVQSFDENLNVQRMQICLFKNIMCRDDEVFNSSFLSSSTSYCHCFPSSSSTTEWASLKPAVTNKWLLSLVFSCLLEHGGEELSRATSRKRSACFGVVVCSWWLREAWTWTWYHHSWAGSRWLQLCFCGN